MYGTCSARRRRPFPIWAVPIDYQQQTSSKKFTA
jgi:hypothetical protein